MSEPPLTCVLVVCREQPNIITKTSIVKAIGSFIDPTSAWSIARACRLPSLRLVQHLVTQELSEAYKRDPFYRQWQFTTGLPSAIASGDMELVKWLVGYYSECQQPSRALGEAAGHGRLEILQWLIARGFTVKSRGDEVEKAVKGDYADLARWLTVNVPSSLGRDSKLKLPALAAANGNIKLLQWSCTLLEPFHRRTSRAVFSLELRDEYQRAKELQRDLRARANTAIEDAVDAAAESGQVAVLEWMINSGKMKKKVRVNLGRLAAGGHFGVMQWLVYFYKKYTRIGTSPMIAARTGQLEMLRWLHREWPLDVTAGANTLMNEALGNGAMEIVEWVSTTLSGNCSPRALVMAAKNGHLNALKWAYENTLCECPPRAVIHAAAEGHLPVIQWLSLNGIGEFTTAAMDSASEHNHLAVVEWLHLNRAEGCTVNSMDLAAANGHLEMVKWLHGNRSEGCTVAAMDGAAKGGHIEIVKWLHANRVEGCTTRAMDSAAGNGNLPLVRWLHLNRLEGCTMSAMDSAAASGHFDVVFFLHHERIEGCSSRAIAEAERNGFEEFLPWFKCNYPTQFEQCRNENLPSQENLIQREENAFDFELLNAEDIVLPSEELMREFEALLDIDSGVLGNELEEDHSYQFKGLL